MGDLSKDFSRKEFKCKDGCGFDTVDAELINEILQKSLRDYYKRKVTVTPNGGCRCNVHNIACDGSNGSQHTKGKAADIKVEGVAPQAVYKHLCDTYPNQYGFGLYDTFVHVDSRKYKARWDNRSKKA